MKINIKQNENEVIVSLQGELDTVATTKMSEELDRVKDLSRNALNNVEVLNIVNKKEWEVASR